MGHALMTLEPPGEGSLQVRGEPSREGESSGEGGLQVRGASR